MKCHMCGKEYNAENMLCDDIYIYYICKNCCKINKELEANLIDRKTNGMEDFFCLKCGIKLCEAENGTKIPPYCEDCALKVLVLCLRNTEDAIYDELLRKRRLPISQ
jgi:hypothetical protein